MQSEGMVWTIKFAEGIRKSGFVDLVTEAGAAGSYRGFMKLCTTSIGIGYVQVTFLHLGICHV